MLVLDRDSQETDLTPTSGSRTGLDSGKGVHRTPKVVKRTVLDTRRPVYPWTPSTPLGRDSVLRGCDDINFIRPSLNPVGRPYGSRRSCGSRVVVGISLFSFWILYEYPGPLQRVFTGLELGTKENRRSPIVTRNRKRFFEIRNSF